MWGYGKGSGVWIFGLGSLVLQRCNVSDAINEKGTDVKSKWWKRGLILKSKLKCYVKPMKKPLGVSPSKGNQGTTRGKEKFLLTSVGIEPTTSGLDLPLLCELSYEVGQRKSGTIYWGGESRRRESRGSTMINLHFRVNSLFHPLCSQCYAAQHSYDVKSVTLVNLEVSEEKWYVIYLVCFQQSTR